jgi:hypothetical protein
MTEAHGDTRNAAARGRALVAEELRRLGATDVQDALDGRRPILAVTTPSGRKIRIVVKTRRRGTWHATARDGRPTPPRAEESCDWVFVDLAADPTWFYVVADWWMRSDIHEVHETYLERHGGTRPRTPDSEHHGIKRERLERWRGAWDGILA